MHTNTHTNHSSALQTLSHSEYDATGSSVQMDSDSLDYLWLPHLTNTHTIQNKTLYMMQKCVEFRLLLRRGIGGSGLYQSS